RARRFAREPTGGRAAAQCADGGERGPPRLGSVGGRGEGGGRGGGAARRGRAAPGGGFRAGGRGGGGAGGPPREPAEGAGQGAGIWAAEVPAAARAVSADVLRAASAAAQLGPPARADRRALADLAAAEVVAAAAEGEGERHVHENPAPAAAFLRHRHSLSQHIGSRRDDCCKPPYVRERAGGRRCPRRSRVAV